jgi:hypothetical protein
MAEAMSSRAGRIVCFASAYSLAARDEPRAAASFAFAATSIRLDGFGSRRNFL